MPAGALPAQWAPVKALARNDAEVTLMMLAQNSVAYQLPSDDPWMPAHRATNTTPVLYQGDYDVTLMGCTDQYQICNAARPDKSSVCTSLTSSYHALENILAANSAIGLNANQIATAGRFLITSSHRTMFQTVQGRGQSALNGKIASDHIYTSVS